MAGCQFNCLGFEGTWKRRKKKRREHVGIGNSKHWSLKFKTFNSILW
jgi:hypothetical protein